MIILPNILSFVYVPVPMIKKGNLLSQKPYKEPGPKTKFFFGRIFPLIFVAVGFGIFWKGSMDMELAKQSESWPTVTGKIISSEVVSKTSTDSNHRTSTTYHAEVNYTYTVEGMTYNGDKVSFGQYGSGNPDHARGIVNIYSEGEEAEVYYKPDDPSVAVLETGVGGGSWIMLIVGSIFGIVGVIMFWKMPAVMNKGTNELRL